MDNCKQDMRFLSPHQTIDPMKVILERMLAALDDQRNIGGEYQILGKYVLITLDVPGIGNQIATKASNIELAASMKKLGLITGHDKPNRTVQPAGEIKYIPIRYAFKELICKKALLAELYRSQVSAALALMDDGGALKMFGRFATLDPISQQVLLHMTQQVPNKYETPHWAQLITSYAAGTIGSLGFFQRPHVIDSAYFLKNHKTPLRFAALTPANNIHIPTIPQ